MKGMKTFGSLFLASMITLSHTSISLAIPSYNEDSHVITVDNDRNIQPLSNRYYTTVVTKSQKSIDFTVSKQEAESRQSYDRKITDTAKLIFGFTMIELSFILVIFNDYYQDPFSREGRYVGTIQTIERVQVDRLTGKQTVMNRGKKLNIKHNGRTITKTLWDKI